MEKLLQIINHQTREYISTGKLNYVTTEALADELKQKRNTVSKQLNKLFDDGKVIKVTTRPVIFLSKCVLEEAKFKLSEQQYESIATLTKSILNPLTELIGSEGSLLSAIQQIESAIMYPDNGLPFILFGETGSGKSYIAKRSYDFAVNNQCIKEGAPFITLNCAQYADNPELLSSMLFGYKKGAFTGADEDKTGLLATADGGVLFLDEVHRLSPESQEKLFIFIDQGTYTPLGEVKKSKKAKVRLIFATTEKKEDFLLATFMRRIPILIELPNLIARREKERLELIYYFLKEESIRMETPISISNKLLNVLLHYPFKGNVGELKNTIKYLCAYQYRKKNRGNHLVINTSIIPDNMYPLPESLEISGKVKNIIVSAATDITTLDGLNPLDETSKVADLYEEILQSYQEQKSEQSSRSFLKEVLPKVDLMMDGLAFNQPKESNYLLLQMINKKVKTIIDFLEEENNLLLFSNGTFVISNYVFYRLQETRLEDNNGNAESAELQRFLITHYASAYEGAKNLIFLLENKFEIYLTIKDELILSLYMISSTIHYWQENRTKCLILAHGFATASSLANLGNRLLKKHLFDAFDMPLDSTTLEIGKNVDDYIKKNSGCEEFIILVDMGSLQEIEKFVKVKDQVTIGIINNVTTAMVLQVGELLINKKHPEEIISKVKDHFGVDSKLHVPTKQQRRVLVTTCMTGIGTATHIKNLLDDSFTNEDEIEIVAIDYHFLKNKGLENRFDEATILAIIGTDDPEIENSLYIPLEKLISGEDDSLSEALAPAFSNKRIEEINRKIVKNFSLEKVIDSITILDSHTVINQIEEVIAQFEGLFDQKIENNIQMTLYVHISCLIERLIRNQPILGYPEEQYADIPDSFFYSIKKILSGIESKYSVTIPSAELGYLYDILYRYQ